MHLFWLVLFVPAVILGQWVWPVLKQRSIWSVLILVAAALVVGWLTLGLASLKGNQWNVSEIAKMFAFRSVAYTDLPLLQLLMASVVGWLRSKRTPANDAVSLETESQLAAW